MKPILFLAATLLLAALLLAGCSRATVPVGAASVSAGPTATADLSGSADPSVSVGPSPSVSTDWPLPAGVIRPYICSSDCAQLQAAVQAELEREVPSYPAISSMELYEQSVVSVDDPKILCQTTMRNLVAITKAPGRPDKPVVVFSFNGVYTAVPWEPVRC